MKAYYHSISGDEFHVFNFLPVTFHIKNGLDDPEFKKFINYYYDQEEKVRLNKQRIRELKEEGQLAKAKQNKKVRNIWIIKPGENTNRGTGIIVSYTQRFMRYRSAKTWMRSRIYSWTWPTGIKPA